MNRIWVTRDEPAGGPLSQAIKDVGLVPIHCPVVHRRQLGDAAKELSQMTASDWIVFTSAYAIDCLDLGLARVPRVAVVGKGTERLARMRGLRVEFVNEQGDADALWKALALEVASGIVLHPRSTLAPAQEQWSGVRLLSPAVYETMQIAFDRSIITRVDAAAVTSASAARSIGKIDLPLASIGPATSHAIRESGMEPWVQAAAPTFVALAEAIAEKIQEQEDRG